MRVMMANQEIDVKSDDELNVVIVASAPTGSSKEERFNSVKAQYEAMRVKQKITRNTSRKIVAAVYG
jgi:hypothetical protein